LAYASWANLSEADLSEASFKGADLSGANLSRAKAIRANFSQACLSWTNFSDAKLSEADLSGADLNGANLSWAGLSQANLSEADLSWAVLNEADLSEAHLRRADLSDANLSDAHLGGACLIETDLSGANLSGADLRGADLSNANLTGANLGRANLGDAYLIGANLSHATLSRANLSEAYFIGANLSGADLSGVDLFETLFVMTDLHNAKGLQSCIHKGPSTIDHRTLWISGQLPLTFLRGCGLPNGLIDYLPSLLNDSVQCHPCYIIYASKDQEFAERLHVDLQNNGIRCWLVPENMKIGERSRRRIDGLIGVHERLLLILSENSVSKEWVENEVETAFEMEEDERQDVLFPVRLDDAIMQCDTGWAADIRRSRHTSDFSRWRNHGAYKKALERLVRDLRMDGKASA
jgi:uncharacterized protein YjbI with pentapeptide repeats